MLEMADQRGIELCWDESEDEMEDDSTDLTCVSGTRDGELRAVLVGRGAHRFGSRLLQRLKTLPPP